MKICIEFKAGEIEALVEGESLGGLKINCEYMNANQIELFLLAVVLPELNRMSSVIESEYNSDLVVKLEAGHSGDPVDETP